MKSDLPKVMHEACGRPMVHWVVEAAKAAGADATTLVIGHGADLVRHAFQRDASMQFAMQMPQLGTGHAVDQARPHFMPLRANDDVFVLCGDGPLIRPETLQTLLATHRRSGASATLATSIIGDASGYGRIERDGQGEFRRIVEQKDATKDQLAIREVNPSYYCFKVGDLFSALARVDNKNASGEYYITDVFELLLKEGKRVAVVDAVPAEDVLSVNTPEQLAEVDSILRRRREAATHLATYLATHRETSAMSAGDREHLKIFAGSSGRALAESLCAHLELPIGQGSPTRFPDGEVFVKLDEDVRGRDCFVVQSTCDPVNDNLMELLTFIDCLRRASAKRITAVIPYFGYARQDRKDEGRVPITAKLVANLITTAGADRVLCMDLHAAQIQGFFDLPVDHLSASPVIADYFLQLRSTLGDCVVVSPDVGNVKVANMYANILGADLAIIDKRRHSGSHVVMKNLIGEVKGRTVLMFDDMISTAGTICEAAKLVMEEGARDVIATATHPVLAGLAIQRLNDSPLSRVVITDTIPGGSRVAPLQGKLVTLSVAQLLGKAIHRIHHDQSVSALFRGGTGTKR